jgi:hypothetical protein
MRFRSIISFSLSLMSGRIRCASCGVNK